MAFTMDAWAGECRMGSEAETSHCESPLTSTYHWNSMHCAFHLLWNERPSHMCPSMLAIISCREGTKDQFSNFKTQNWAGLCRGVVCSALAILPSLVLEPLLRWCHELSLESKALASNQLTVRCQSSDWVYLAWVDLDMCMWCPHQLNLARGQPGEIPDLQIQGNSFSQTWTWACKPPA